MIRRLIGLAASLGILLLVVGIPVGLYVAAGSPIPGSVPDFGAIADGLTRPDDGSMFMALLKVVGWIAWASFAAMVMLEIAARARGVQAPRIPALGLQQRAAAGLVAAAALLFTAVPLMGPVAPASADTAGSAPSHSSSTVTVASSATVDLEDEQQVPAVEPATAEAHDLSAHTRAYVVQQGDSLYSIAEDLLGDGARYSEIAQLNYGVTQADGGALTNSHWIQPGWTLQIPADAAATSGGEQVVVEAGDTLSAIAKSTLGDATRYPELFEASRDTVQPGGAHLVDPDLIQPGWTITVPGPGEGVAAEQAPETAPAASAPHVVLPAPVPAPAPAPIPEAAPAPVAADEPGAAAAAQEADTEDAVDAAEEGFPVRTAAGVGSLLAAGLLALLAARRQRQQRRRKPGQTLPMPTGEALAVEQELRSLADPMSVETVDLALRTLSARCTAERRPLPRVRAARLTADQFDLYLAEPAQLPAPWDGTVDGTVWTLAAEAGDLIHAEEVEAVPAPYPALVTIGHDDEDGHVFLDLEYLGSLGVTGDDTQARQVMAALAVELATSRWADDLQITLVGAYAELEDSLETGRVRYVPAVGRLLEELQHRADLDRAALRDSGAGDLNHARVQNAVPGAWTPEIVLLTGDLTDRQRSQLQELVHELPRVAIAAVTRGEAVGEWALRLTGDQTGILEPFGLSVRPQLLDDQTYAQVLQVLATTDVDDESIHLEWENHAEPTLADVEHLVSAVADHATPPSTNQEDHVTDQASELQLEPVAEVRAVDEPDQVDSDELVVESDTTADLQEEPPVDDLAVELVEDAQGELSDPIVTEQVSTGDVSEANGQEDAPADTAVGEPQADVKVLPRRAPQLLLLGPVEIINATGSVEPSKRGRFTELAAIISTNPGCDHTTIDDCYSPKNRPTNNGRNTTMSKLRRWLGTTAEGDYYLPHFEVEGSYRLHPLMRSDWDTWRELLPDGPATATTGALEEALKLVRGRPFDGVKARHYAWAETLKQQMISTILDASYELARRRLMDGRWRAAEEATLIGLSIEPGMESLWRIRILAAHAHGNANAVHEAIERLLAVAEDWGGDLEEETEDLLQQISTGSVPGRDKLASTRL